MGSFEFVCNCILAAGLAFLLDVNYNPVQDEIGRPSGAFSFAYKSLEQKQLKESRIMLCITRKPCALLAEAVYFESRGEPLIGQRAVAFTVLNRVKADRWPDTVEGVLHDRCQFTYTCDGSRSKGITDEKSHRKALLIAYKALEGISEDPTNGADHYYEPTKVKRKPLWAKVYKNVAVLGNHWFYQSPKI